MVVTNESRKSEVAVKLLVKSGRFSSQEGRNAILRQ